MDVCEECGDDVGPYLAGDGRHVCLDCLELLEPDNSATLTLE